MRLYDLLQSYPFPYATQGNMEVEIATLATNSRLQAEKGLFFCIRGLTFDAHRYAGQAGENGCVALVVDHFIDSGLPQVKVENVRCAAAYIASTFYDHPSHRLQMIGITGTKGKTTTSYLVKSILEQAGMKVGLIGTTGNMIGSKLLPGNMTTPDPVELHSLLRRMADEEVEAVVMEVSAHAIDMHRLDGILYEAAAYTNLSHDHLDYFHDMENYFQTKKSFFTGGAVLNGAFNLDDETTARILEEFPNPSITYAIGADGDVTARDIDIGDSGVSFTMKIQSTDEFCVHMHLTGMFNIYNALCAASLCAIMGIEDNTIKAGLEAVTHVPGRVEVLETGTSYKVILDYAHSPDALHNVLSTIRAFTKKRLIAVVGCGGDRDREKRPVMGEIVGHLADYSILTSDNPRNEDPMEILNAIEQGIRKTAADYCVIENRREAIRHALLMAQEGDIVILAGKGDETYQDIKGVKHPFDEKIVVRELLSEINGDESK